MKLVLKNQFAQYSVAIMLVLSIALPTTLIAGTVTRQIDLTATGKTEAKATQLLHKKSRKKLNRDIRVIGDITCGPNNTGTRTRKHPIACTGIFEGLVKVPNKPKAQPDEEEKPDEERVSLETITIAKSGTSEFDAGQRADAEIASLLSPGSIRFLGKTCSRNNLAVNLPVRCVFTFSGRRI